MPLQTEVRKKNLFLLCEQLNAAKSSEKACDYVDTHVGYLGCVPMCTNARDLHRSICVPIYFGLCKLV